MSATKIPAPQRAGTVELDVDEEIEWLVATMRWLRSEDPEGYQALVALIAMVEKKSS